MEPIVQPYSHLMLITGIWALVASVVAALVWGSRSTRSRKSPPAPAPTEISDALLLRMAQIEATQAELFSTLESLTTTVKRLSSRQGMRDVRARRATEDPPPIGAPKADLLRHYGMSGKVGPAFARAQMDLGNLPPAGEIEEGR